MVGGGRHNGYSAGAKLWPCRLLVFFPKVVLGVDKDVTNNAGTFAV